MDRHSREDGAGARRERSPALERRLVSQMVYKEESIALIGVFHAQLSKYIDWGSWMLRRWDPLRGPQWTVSGIDKLECTDNN